MKKITLKNLNSHEVEKLTTDQLKNVLGGQFGSGGPENIQCHSEPRCSAGCAIANFCSTCCWA